METSRNQSTLEMLPDEVLLEVCKYLLCNDILQSFVGLNNRITQMITQYRHHVSLYKTSLSKFHYLRINVFPQIGYQIRSLLIDSDYSVLQDELFMKYFGEKMSMMFPQLERISLMSYRQEQLLDFLSTLDNLDHLVEIRLYTLLPIKRLQQPTVVRSLLQVNNNRLTTLLIDDKSSSLSFNDSDRYLNVVQLSIKVETATDLSSLFAAVPNVHKLEVVIEKADRLLEYFNKMNLSSLFHLTDFRLKSISRIWKLEELFLLLAHLPAVRHLSLFLSTYDRRLIDGSVILSSLTSTVQQFNYAIYFISNTKLDVNDTTADSWPPSHPVACFFNDRFLWLHTLPWRFPRIVFFSIDGQLITSYRNSGAGYNRHVEELCFEMSRNISLNQSLTILSQYCRVREISIHVENDGNAVIEKQPSISRLPKLSRLKQVCFYGTIPTDLNHFSLVLNAASNLFRLDLPINHLLKLFEDPEICCLLGQRITAFCISKSDPSSSSVTLDEEHISVIASVFSRAQDMYFDITHLPCSATITLKENTFDGLLIQDVSVQSTQQKNEVISSGSSESMLLCLLTKFKEHKVVGLCVSGQFLEEIKTDAEQWLQNNTILCERQFKAAFYNELNRLFIWM